jgi:hypothetical protein
MWAGADSVQQAWSFVLLGLLKKEVNKKLCGWYKFLTLTGAQCPVVVALYYETGAHWVKQGEATNEVGAPRGPSAHEDCSAGARLTRVSASVAAQVNQLVINSIFSF